MESVPSMPLSANAPDGALASRADVAPPAAVHSNGAARSEPDTGGWRGACPRTPPYTGFGTHISVIPPFRQRARGWRTEPTCRLGSI